jgi:hypothetical protein
MRSICAPYVVAPPTGMRIRTRLRLTPADEQVATAVGRHLATLAGQDLAWRCRLGLGADQRTKRKRSLTAASSSRWAGTITRTANDQWKRGYKNLLDARTGLRRAILAIDRRRRSRLLADAAGCGAMPVGPSGTRSSAASSTCRPGWPWSSGGLPRAGCRCAVVAGASPSSVTTSTRRGCPPPNGEAAGMLSGCSSPPTGRPRHAGAT